jgi:hypothetical protein
LQVDLREIIKGTDDKKLAAVATPEWPEADGQLFARKASMPQRALFFGEVRERKIPDGADFVAFVVACLTCNADGQAVFQPDDYLWLRDKDADAIGRLFAAIDEKNLLSVSSQKELEKNSEAPPTLDGT